MFISVYIGETYETFIKKILIDTPLYPYLSHWLTKKAQLKELAEWEKSGRPLPPPHLIKQQTIKYYAKKYDLKILVETGTYYGYMVEAIKNDFDHIYTIELSHELHELAKKKFTRKKHINLYSR